MNVRYKKVETIQEFIDHIRLRVDVFLIEQKLELGWEPDEEDKVSKQFIGFLEDGAVISTARYLESAPGEMRIARVTTHRDYRKKGVGRCMMEFVIREIKKENPKRIWQHADVRAQKFYEKCGFCAITKPVDEGWCVLVDMEYAKKT